VLRRVIGTHPAGPVFLRRRYDPGSSPAGLLDQSGLARLLERRAATEAGRVGHSLTRAERAWVARGIWRDAGAIDPDQVLTAFPPDNSSDRARRGDLSEELAAHLRHAAAGRQRRPADQAVDPGPSARLAGLGRVGDDGYLHPLTPRDASA
jgi:hypothetical protein